MSYRNKGIYSHSLWEYCQQSSAVKTFSWCLCRNIEKLLAQGQAPSLGSPQLWAESGEPTWSLRLRALPTGCKCQNHRHHSVSHHLCFFHFFCWSLRSPSSNTSPKHRFSGNSTFMAPTTKSNLVKCNLPKDFPYRYNAAVRLGTVSGRSRQQYLSLSCQAKQEGAIRTELCLVFVLCTLLFLYMTLWSTINPSKALHYLNRNA